MNQKLFRLTGNGSGGGGGLTPAGNWNANTNSPDITGETVTGKYWVVSVAGATDLDGITTWEVNDWAVKTSTGWMRIRATANTAYTRTFVEADLAADILTVAHGLGQLGGLAVTVSDNNGVVVYPVIDFTTTNALTLDFTGFTPLTGTWTVGVIKAGGAGTGAGTAAEDIVYDPVTSGLTATDVQAAIDELAASGGGGGDFLVMQVFS